MPGRPCPTVPNDLRSLELPVLPTVGAGAGCAPVALGVIPPAPVTTGCKAGWRLGVDGAGVGEGVGDTCAPQGKANASRPMAVSA